MIELFIGIFCVLILLISGFSAFSLFKLVVMKQREMESDICDTCGQIVTYCTCVKTL